MSLLCCKAAWANTAGKASLNQQNLLIDPLLQHPPDCLVFYVEGFADNIGSCCSFRHLILAIAEVIYTYHVPFGTKGLGAVRRYSDYNQQ